MIDQGKEKEDPISRGFIQKWRSADDPFHQKQNDSWRGSKQEIEIYSKEAVRRGIQDFYSKPRIQSLKRFSRKTASPKQNTKRRERNAITRIQ